MSEIKDKTIVARLQSGENISGLTGGIKDWHKYTNSLIYDDDQINALESSNKESLHQPTSIPSPFARIALVKTAFGEVAEHDEKALKAYQKIVSDTLDVAEIFFTFEKWKNKIEIIKWDKKEDLEKLKNHKILHKTLKTFLDNDAEAYNFNEMKCLYILKYKATGEMIGATSPCTLFFSSGNDLSKVDIPLNSTHKAFKEIVPLHKRNWGFQKYLYTWLAANNSTKQIGDVPVSIFAEFQNYLNAQKQISIKNEEKIATDFEISNAKTKLKNTKKYKPLRAPNVEILGNECYCLELREEDNENQEIKKEILEVSDLLQDKIIRLPYAICKESFFDGKLSDSKQTYLLPVKDEFFKHYTIDDLKGSLNIDHAGDVADVTLKIDGKEYKKEYKKSDGTIVEPSGIGFDCAIFPNVKFEKDKYAHYRFGLVCDFNDKDKFSVEFVKIGAKITSKKRESVRNETNNSSYQLKNYSLEGSNFDYIKLIYDGICGVVMPILELKNGSKEFTFAVDIGTTNTHIEYKEGSDTEIKFDIKNKEERQVHLLHGAHQDIKNVFDEEFIPAYTDNEFKFPMRTALSFGEKTDWKDVYPFEKANPAVLYEKRLNFEYNEITTNLKWSDSDDNKKQIEVYIHSLMYLLRNKVIIANGSLEKTKIKWFYPVAMERNRYNNFKKAWDDAYVKYFGSNTNNILSITESVAPFEYYVRDGNTSNLVTIDIGGGTTDIVISNNNQTANYITSFRFAANTIFGDGYGETKRIKNGIVRQFSDVIISELQTKFTNKTDDLFAIYEDMIVNKGSSDIASFLFSLRNNKTVNGIGENFAQNVNLSKKLSDDTTQKITFIFFYAAIIYHLAKIMKSKDLDMPDKIVFSGNGSRVIPLFTNDESLLTGFTKLIFIKVYEVDKYNENGLEIILNEKEPKEATCKGGFYIVKPDSYSNIFKKKVVLHSNGTNTVFQRKTDDLSSKPKTEDTNKAVNDDYLSKTTEEAKVFIQFVFDLLPFFANNGYKLNSESVAIAKETCFKKLDIYTNTGWNLKKKEVSDDEVIDETLFFYPLVGMLKELSDAICNKNLSNIK